MEETRREAIAGSAHMIEVEDGRLISDKPVAGNLGTNIEVHNLFFNVPARKKYLKSINAEFRHIVDIVTRYILINPLIHFKLIHNDILVINSPSTTDTLANISTVYGRSITKNLLPLNFSFFDVEIMGYISKPDSTRADRNYQSIFVNRRYIKSSIIQKAVYDAYGQLLFHGRHPLFVLDIKMNPKRIDVNVHPQKSTIRIEKEDEIYSAVKNGVLGILMKEKLVPMIDNFKTTPIETKLSAHLSTCSTINITGKGVTDKGITYNVITDKESTSVQSRLASSDIQDTPLNNHTPHAPKISGTEDQNKRKILLLGTLHNTYILAQDEEGLLMIDQHAAHERVMYEQYLKQFRNDALKVQELISPVVIEANPGESLIIEENIQLLSSLGIIIELFGKSTFIIRALPSIIFKQQTPALINDIIDELNNDELNRISQIKEERIAMAACKSAVKAYEALETHQITKILEDLFKCENPNTCPHGRPTMICFPTKEIERKFKRIV